MSGKYRHIIGILHQILNEIDVPLYMHPKSKHTFTVHQHIIMLVLRQYESKSYEDFAEWLSVSTEIVDKLGLKQIPHFTTLQKAAAWIDEQILHIAIGRFIGMASTCPITGGVDGTGFEDRHAAPYYTYRCNVSHGFTKMSAGSDMESQLICAVVIQHHPVSHDIKHFPELFKKMLAIIAIWMMVLDKGYDSEPVHKRIRAKDVLSMIPVRGDNSISSTRGKYRKLMRREFDKEIYHERNKTEAIFSVIKRKFGSELKSHGNAMKTKELLCRVMAYNCHRMYAISFVLMMISRKPIQDQVK